MALRELTDNKGMDKKVAWDIFSQYRSWAAARMRKLDMDASKIEGTNVTHHLLNYIHDHARAKGKAAKDTAPDGLRSAAGRAVTEAVIDSETARARAALGLVVLNTLKAYLNGARDMAAKAEDCPERDAMISACRSVEMRLADMERHLKPMAHEARMKERAYEALLSAADEETTEEYMAAI